jgi:fatty-acyl-CoA synthase
MYIGDWLARREMLTPNKVALVDALHDNRPITFREWNRAANRTANFLRERLRVQKGDRVAVLATNCVEYLDVWFACGKLGAILQTLNWRLTPRELAELIADASPRVFVYGADLSQVDDLRAMNAVPDLSVSVDLPGRQEHSDAPPPRVELSWNDPWVICYTGGTTGLPKRAVLTHRSITANSVNTVMSWG